LHGIENYTGTRYVACFCNLDYEVVPFWYVYGMGSRREKVMLRFKDFSSYADDVLDCSTGKIFSTGESFYFAPYQDRQSLIIQDIKIFDIEYRKRTDPVFNKKYDWITFESVPTSEQMQAGKPLEFTYHVDAAMIGMCKTINWDYEHETRIMCEMNVLDVKKKADALLVSLKDKMFEDLQIVLNPWASDEFYEKVKMIIDKSNLSSELKATIKIQRSELDGLLIEGE
jgi:hypothetical protein